MDTSPQYLNAPPLYPGALALTNEAYHADTSRLSKSALDKLAKSPAHYFEAYRNPDAPPRERTEAMRIGSAYHCAVLEPGTFAATYAVVPDDAPARPTAAMIKAKNPAPESIEKIQWWEKFEIVNAGREILSAKDYDRISRMRDAVWAHPLAAQILSAGWVENTFHFTEPETGAPCKIKPDFLSTLPIVADLKSTEDASPRGFAQSVRKYRYDVQAAFYLDGLRAAGVDAFEEFVFIAQEKEAPYAVACYHLKPDDLAVGRSKYLEDLTTWTECERTGSWPAYSDLVMPLEIFHPR